MKFLFVAPEICTPITEGRKRYVLDLIDELSTRHDVFLLTTTEAGQETNVSVPVITSEHRLPSSHITSLVGQLFQAIRSNEPDVICLFPYGTFRHLYGIASILFINAVDTICRIKHKPCITIMYSIDNSISIRRLAKYIPRLGVSGRDIEKTLNINVGIRCAGIEQRSNRTDSRKILFMAGMWQVSSERLEHIIQVRGLGVLLQIGEVLSKNNISLMVAAPLFRSSECRKNLLNHRLNSWPEGRIELLDQVRVPEIFERCDIFIFPYQENITQFVPTSVLEAMCSGCCTAVTEQPFLRSLSQEGEMAFLLSRDDPMRVAEQIIDAINDVDSRNIMAKRAREYVKENWSIENSSRQLENYAKKLANF